MTLSAVNCMGLAGAAVVGVAFRMARYGYGLTLPGIREGLRLSELVLGLVSSATFAGYLAGLLLAGRLAARHGSRAPTTVGGVCGAADVATGALAQRVGSLRVAALCLVTVGAALAILGLARDSLTATMASACIFGVGYRTGSTVLAVWTADLVPTGQARLSRPASS